MTTQRGGDTPDPLLIADIEDIFDSLDPLSLLNDALNSEYPGSAAVAYEQLVSGEWDGDE
ncbi:hypothetical protein [Streptomyces sp. NBC_01353]|uniref:hypothetical protein n=1 Tax=Streptomyces sp. NBC_01353 TaxID=2903835 RepID=UPI002E31B19D|nr:hypothetical protein [Streptomyces sp. NBC_01353]